MLDTSIFRRFSSVFAVTAVVWAYFVIFPEDLNVLLAPLQSLLTLTTAISPWLYLFCAVAVVCWTFRPLLKRPDST